MHHFSITNMSGQLLQNSFKYRFLCRVKCFGLENEITYHLYLPLFLIIVDRMDSSYRSYLVHVKRIIGLVIHQFTCSQQRLIYKYYSHGVLRLQQTRFYSRMSIIRAVNNLTRLHSTNALTPAYLFSFRTRPREQQDTAQLLGG